MVEVTSLQKKAVAMLKEKARDTTLRGKPKIGYLMHLKTKPSTHRRMGEVTSSQNRCLALCEKRTFGGRGGKRGTAPENEVNARENQEVVAHVQNKGGKKAYLGLQPGQNERGCRAHHTPHTQHTKIITNVGRLALTTIVGGFIHGRLQHWGRGANASPHGQKAQGARQPGHGTRGLREVR